MQLSALEIPQIIRSKKALAAGVASVISYFAVDAGMTLEQIALITGPIYAYIGGQALADFGKEGTAIPAVFARAPEAPKTTNVTVRSGATVNIGEAGDQAKEPQSN